MLPALRRANEHGSARASGVFHMIVCTRCGATNQPTSKFCLYCGTPLAAAAAPPPAYGAPQPAPAPQPPVAAPQPAPAWGPPPAPAPQQYGQPPAAQPWQQPPPAAPAYGAPPQPAWNPGPQDQAGFAAPAVDRARFGTPEGMNPFGATVGPDFGAASQGAYGPPPAPPQYAAPPAQAYAPPPAQA